MKIDNENATVKRQALKYIYAIAVLTIIAVLYTTNVEPYLIQYLGITNTWISIALIVAYLIYYFFHLYRKTSYLYLSDDGDKIVIRFYQLKPLNPKKSAYEIQKNQFYKFTYHKSFLREEVTVFQKYGSTISKYPPFSLKGLSEEQKALVFLTLKQYQQV